MAHCKCDRNYLRPPPIMKFRLERLWLSRRSVGVGAGCQPNMISTGLLMLECSMRYGCTCTDFTHGDPVLKLVSKMIPGSCDLEFTQLGFRTDDQGVLQGLRSLWTNLSSDKQYCHSSYQYEYIPLSNGHGREAMRVGGTRPSP